MSLLRIDHTAIVVRDLDAALDRYHRLLGVEAAERTTVADQQVEIAFLRLGDTQLELIQPITTTSGVAHFLDRQGEGLHHLGIVVDDLDAELQRLGSEGAELIDRQSRPGAHGMIAFVHPRSTGGVLLELIERR